MKKSILITIIFLSSLSLSAQTLTNEQSKVEETLKAFFQGFSELNILKIKQHSTNDLMILESGEIWNLDTLVKRLEPMRKMKIKRINEFKFIKTELTGNIAWVAYYNTAHLEMNEKKRSVNWMESAVLIKEGNEWKIKFLHSTEIKPKGR